MDIVIAIAAIVVVIWYVKHRFASTSIDRTEIEEAEKEAKKFADSHDFRKM